MNHSEDPNLHSTLELDHDALNFACLEEYLCPDVVGIPDGGIDGTGQINFGFGTDDIPNQEHLFPLSFGARYNGNLTFPSDGQVIPVAVGIPIDIPNYGGHHRRKNSPLTPPDSDGPDSPDRDQVFLPDSMASGSLVPHSAGVQLQQGEAFSHTSRELLSQSLSISAEPKRKRKRSSECSETLTTNGLSSLRLGSLKSESDDYHLDSCSPESVDSPDPQPIPATLDPENSYQCLKWSLFKPDECCNMYDGASQIVPPPQFRVDADKGFNYSFADEAFVCQKKNHLQVTAYMSLLSEQSPKYIQVENELKRIEKFCLHLYGIKMESQASKIGVEQSQADRSKRHYEPLEFNISPKEQAKITVGRLHFSETTANNMRKKGKPNPDQRYFLLVVAVYAHTKNKEYLVCANVSERIIVRASNPGQFENDMEVVWSRGQTTDSVFRMGRVGVNTDKPEEALSVYGNLKVTGRLVHPSDIRVKESIEEVDSREQLRNVSKMKLYRYRYSREYLEHAGLATDDCVGEDTGVLAQEVKEVLPEAVKESDDVVFSDGKIIEGFLVVNKERIFMENVGAVKELVKLTDNLQVRIDELETVNQKFQRRRCDTVSTFSSLSLSRASSLRASINSKKQNQEHRKKCHHHHCHHHHHRCACRHQGEVYGEQVWCSPKFMQFLIVILVLVMILSIGGMAIIYVLEIQDDDLPQKDSEHTQTLTGQLLPTAVGSNGSNMITTRESPLANLFTMGPPRKSALSSSSYVYTPTNKIVLRHSTMDQTWHNGSNMITTRESPLANLSTMGPPRKSALSSSSYVYTPTNKIVSRHSTGKTSPVTLVSPFSSKLKPSTNVNSSTASPGTLPITKVDGPIQPTEEKTPVSRCCSQQITDHPIERLQGIEVYYDKQKLTGVSGSQSGYPEFRILEDNYIIKCSNCSSQNSSHYIPFSSHLPFKAITLEINSTSSSLVFLCSHNFKYGCPEMKEYPTFNTSQNQDTWKKNHRWQLPVAYYYQSTFHFRLVKSQILSNVTCKTTPHVSGPLIQDFYFHFVRKCSN